MENVSGGGGSTFKAKVSKLNFFTVINYLIPFYLTPAIISRTFLDSTKC